MITMDKQYRYRGTYRTLHRVLCNDRNNDRSVLSLDTEGTIHSHTSDGFFCKDKTENPLDLIEVVPLWRGECWVNSDGDVRNLRVITESDAAFYGWRKITAVEERKEDA